MLQKEEELHLYRSKRAKQRNVVATSHECVSNDKEHGLSENNSLYKSSNNSKLRGYNSSGSHATIVPTANVPRSQSPKSSPPRVENNPSIVDIGTNTLFKKTVSQNQGPGVSLNDADLVIMLQRPPKAVPQLRTKSGYIDYFRGMPAERMKSLLIKAYSTMDMHEDERNAKVDKRMNLIAEILI